MADRKPTIYCGSGREFTKGSFWKIGLMFTRDNLDLMYNHLNERDVVFVDVTNRRNPDDKQTHNVSINQWKPQQKQAEQQEERRYGAGDAPPPMPEMPVELYTRRSRNATRPL